MKLSIIVPIYNVEKYLKKCLDSLVLQEEDNCEIILVDDGSTDSSFEICKEYEKKHKNIYLYHKQNGGLSDARNFGISKSTGEYLWFIDSDDYVEKNSISEVIKKLEKYNSDILIIKSKIFDENSNIYDECKYSIDAGLYSNEEYLKLLKKNPKGVIFCAQYHICKKSLIITNKLYFYKGIIHEDELWTPQILIKSKSIYYSNLNIYYHYMRSDSIMHSSKIERSGKCDIFVSKELFKIYNDTKLTDIKYLYDRAINIYFQAIWKLPKELNDSILERCFFVKKAYYCKTKIKAIIYFISPSLYLYIHNKNKKEV